MPPALVARLPPIVQLPSEPSDIGNNRSTEAAAACTSASTTPASTVIVAGDRVDVADGAHPAEREHDLAPGGVRDPAADQAGVAALGDDRDPGLVAGRHDGGHLGGRAGPDHCERLTGVHARPVHDVRRHVLVGGQHVGVADGVAQPVEQVGHGCLLGGGCSAEHDGDQQGNTRRRV